MKVAIVSGAGIVSGKEVMVLELAEGLRDAGIEVHLITSRWGSGEFAKRDQAADLYLHRLWLGFISATLSVDSLRMNLDQLWHWPSLLLNYRRFLKDVAPTNVVHTNWHHALLLWPFLDAKRDIYWLHETVPDKPHYGRLFRRLSHRVRCFVAVSEAVARSLSKLGVPESEIRVIHNGISDPAGNLSAETSHSVPRIGIVGQVGSWKGHEDLLAAFQVVLTQFPAELHIFGKGSNDYEELLRNRATALEVDGSVVWHGFVKNSAEIYSEMDILVAPSRFEEPFGLTAVEAAFFGVPVVASRRGGLTEVVKDNMTGLLFEAGNVSELADRLLTLLKDPDLQSRIGQNARVRARNYFNRDRFVRDFCTLFRKRDNGDCP